MFARQQDARQVGAWIVIAAAVVGLLVLLLHGRALAGQPLSAEALADVLAERAPITAQERVDAVEALLRRDRNGRAGELARALLSTSFGLWQGASPRRALSGGRRVFKAARGLLRRSPAEDRALELLESAVYAGSSSPRLDAMYTRLLERERKRFLGRKLEAAERALERGHLRLARVRLRRSLELDPHSQRAVALLARLDEGAGEAIAPESSDFVVREWEAGLALALLLDDHERALRLGDSAPDAGLAHGVAHYLSGDRGAARALFFGLAARGDAVGAAARSFAARPDLNVAERLDRAERHYWKARALGWVGGQRLADSGFDLSSRGYKAWRQSVAPANLAISAPLRLYRGWQPDSEELRSAARLYLDVASHGEQADDAAQWLAELQAEAPAASAPWDDGRFVLPRAHTRYRALSPRPLLVARAAFERAGLHELGRAHQGLGTAAALRLRLHRGAAAHVNALPAAEARELLERLAGGLEARRLRGHQRSQEVVLEALRRLEDSLGSGQQLIAEPWSPSGFSLGSSLVMAALDGDAQRLGSVELDRGDDEISLARAFGRVSYDCPAGVDCIDGVRRISGTLYGELDLDADFHLGARTTIVGASLALELSSSGPVASLVVPLGDWLGVDRWIPLEAHVRVGLAGVSFAPSLGDN